MSLSKQRHTFSSVTSVTSSDYIISSPLDRRGPRSSLISLGTSWQQSLIESGTKPSILRSKACYKGCFTSFSIAWGGDGPYSKTMVTTYHHTTAVLMTDVKPDKEMVNYGDRGSRFSDVKLADCGDSTHIDSVFQEHIIGATIFWSLEMMLSLF